MSSRKRAIKRARKAGRSPADAPGRQVRDPSYWGAPEGTPIAPGMKPARAVRDDVNTQLREFVHDPGRSPEDQAAIVAKQTDRMIGSIASTSSRDLRIQEKHLADIVENKVNPDTGRHSEIPAFHKDKAVAADMWLQGVRGELAQRATERNADVRKDSQGKDGIVGKVVGEHELRKRDDDELRRMARDAVIVDSDDGTPARRSESGDTREYADRQRRRYWEGRNRALVRDRNAAPDTSPQWAKDAAGEMNLRAWAPDKRRNAEGKLRKTPDADVARIKAVREHVAEVANKQGVPETTVVQAIMSGPHGDLDLPVRKAFYAAYGVRPKESTPPVGQVREPANMPMRPVRNVHFRKRSDLKTMDDDSLKTYGMDLAANVGHRDREVGAKARLEHGAVLAELNRRKSNDKGRTRVWRADETRPGPVPADQRPKPPPRPEPEPPEDTSGRRTSSSRSLDIGAKKDVKELTNRQLANRITVARGVLARDPSNAKAKTMLSQAEREIRWRKRPR